MLKNLYIKPIAEYFCVESESSFLTESNITSQDVGDDKKISGPIETDDNSEGGSLSKGSNNFFLDTENEW